MLKGCFPALVTPITSDKENLDSPVNFEALENLVEYVISGGVDGVVPLGCTGHANSFDMEEQEQIVQTVLDIAKGKEVIVGDGSNYTKQAIEDALCFEDFGIKTHLQISPYQNKPMQEGLFMHYGRIANAIQGELIIYNVPGRTARSIEPDTVVRLAREYSNIIAVKEASGDIDKIKKIIDETSDLENFSVLSGDDGLTYEIIKNGGYGVISVSANIDPKKTSDMVHYALEGQYESAIAIDEQLRDLYEALFIETNPIPAHYMLTKVGIDAGVPRLPLTPLTEESRIEVDKVMKNLGIAYEF
ncbi:MAG: 4-hydroxy-tetrahydrodipicolinate synthase [Candidatus Aenigmatarchaeota archaeon]